VLLRIEYLDGRDPQVAGVLRRDADAVTGEVSTDEQVMRVDRNCGPDVQREIVLHEAIHAILNLTGQGNVAEGVTQTLGNGLLMFLRENRDAVRWMQEDAEFVHPLLEKVTAEFDAVLSSAAAADRDAEIAKPWRNHAASLHEELSRFYSRNSIEDRQCSVCSPRSERLDEAVRATQEADSAGEGS
jgi:hypothetical protein